MGGRAFSGMNKSGFQSLVPTVPGQYATVPEDGCQRCQQGTEQKANGWKSSSDSAIRQPLSAALDPLAITVWALFQRRRGRRSPLAQQRLGSSRQAQRWSPRLLRRESARLRSRAERTRQSPWPCPLPARSEQ